MSYYVRQRKSSFFISKDHIEGVLKDLNKLANSGFKTIDDVFENFNFEVVYDQEWNITDLKLKTVQLPEFDFFTTIAAFVKDHSFLEFVGEDYNIFRYYFYNGGCAVEDAKVLYASDIKENLLSAYESNAEELLRLRQLERTGQLDIVKHVSETFTQGYNNALEYAMELLNIKY